MRTFASSAATALFFLGCIAIGLAWQIPTHYPPWLAFQQEFVAGVGAALVAWAAFCALPRVRWPRLALLALMLASVPLLQRASGLVDFNSTALLAALYLVGFGLAVTAGANLAGAVDGRHRLDGLMALLAVSAGIGALLAMMQWLGIGVPSLWIAELHRGSRPSANFAQPNHLATLLAFGIAAVLYAFEQRRLAALPSAVAAAFLGFALIATQSRTGWCFVVLLVAGGVFLRRRLGLRVAPRALVGGAALFFLGVLIWQPLNEALGLGSSASLESRLHAGPRQVLWPAMLEAALRRPWTGYGWAQGGKAQLETALEFEPTHYVFKNAHNQLLDLVLWNGWPLGLLVIGALGAWFARRVRACRTGPNAALLLAVAAAWLHALVEYPLDYAYFLLPVGLLMGAVESEREIEARQGAPRWTFVLPLALASALTCWIAVEYVEIEASTRVLRFVGARIGVDNVPAAPRPEVTLLDAELAQFDFATQQPKVGMSKAELGTMKSVVESNAFPGAMFRYATALGLNGRAHEAAMTLERLCRISMPSRCEEARVAWREQRAVYPELAAIAEPAPF